MLRLTRRRYRPTYLISSIGPRLLLRFGFLDVVIQQPKKDQGQRRQSEGKTIKEFGVSQI
jgi:hypothetical protein